MPVVLDSRRYNVVLTDLIFIGRTGHGFAITVFPIRSCTSDKIF